MPSRTFDNLYPETTVELREIGTDPLRVEAFSRDFRQHLGEGWFGEYGKIKTILDPKGYVAPPLDGVWATAPYLHDGSAPTLAERRAIKKPELRGS